MGEILLGTLVAVSFAVSVAMEFTKRRIVRRAPPDPARSLPPVSVREPLRGADPSLEANLDSAFRLGPRTLLAADCAESARAPAPVRRARSAPALPAVAAR
jgi:hypothetical protein